jgi:tetratricopeptide (TPR) repeat protein/glycosyltransferase involved in cell wall biosynthesis
MRADTIIDNGVIADVAEKNSPIERMAKAITLERRQASNRFKQEGTPLTDVLKQFDNDYTGLADLYKEKVGVNLIGDPFEDADHPIPISKSCSVVIPAYNTSAQLEKTLLGIAASSFNAKYPQQLEVVIVDDGSPRVDIAKQVAAMEIKDLTVKVLRQTNGRENKGRYSGVVAASGDIILFTAQDVVYSPTMIEAYMKRHEILDDIACFAFKQEIATHDQRLEQEAIEKGSLGQLPYDFKEDGRIAKDGMADCDWLKNGGNDKPLPIDVDNDDYYWDWKVPSVAYGFSVSAPREMLLKTIASHDERYTGFGGDDGHMVSDLIAEGAFVIPNTGGIVYHQSHPSRWDGDEARINKNVWQEHLRSPLRRQNPKSPLQTDAVVQFEQHNDRQEAKEPLPMKTVDAYQRGVGLLKMGQYEQALKLLTSIEADHKDDVWFLHDKAVALTAVGGGENINQAVVSLEQAIEQAPENAAIFTSLAIAYGRAGRFVECKMAYQRASALASPDEKGEIIISGDEEKEEAARQLHDKGKIFLTRGNPREALRYYEAELALVGEEKAPWGLFDRAIAFSQLGHMQDALGMLDTVSRMLPKNTWVASRRGLLYEQIGDKRTAEVYFKEALGEDADNTEAQEGLQRVGRILSLATIAEGKSQ